MAAMQTSDVDRWLACDRRLPLRPVAKGWLFRVAPMSMRRPRHEACVDQGTSGVLNNPPAATHRSRCRREQCWGCVSGWPYVLSTAKSKDKLAREALLQSLRII